MSMMEETEDPFWGWWINRFEDEYDKYITPDERMVKRFARKIATVGGDDYDRAVRASQYIENKIDYELSKEWKVPRKTINQGRGDCEDVTFLLASVLPNLRVEESEVVVGDLVFPDGEVEEHTWNRVDGKVLDATGPMEVYPRLKYRELNSWTVIQR